MNNYRIILDPQLRTITITKNGAVVLLIEPGKAYILRCYSSEIQGTFNETDVALDETRHYFQLKCYDLVEKLDFYCECWDLADEKMFQL